jgi:hypothetical protein
MKDLADHNRPEAVIGERRVLSSGSTWRSLVEPNGVLNSLPGVDRLGLAHRGAPLSKRRAVVSWRQTNLREKVVPQSLYAREARLGSHLFDLQRRRLKETPGFIDAHLRQPIRRRLTHSLCEATQERPRAHHYEPCHLIHAPSTGGLCTQSIDQNRKLGITIGKHRSLDELGLPTLPMGRHHDTSRYAASGSNAEVLADDV